MRYTMYRYNADLKKGNIMNRLKIMEKRRSIRAYKDMELSDVDQKKVDDIIGQIPQISHMVAGKIHKVDDAAACYEKLDGHAGYNGIMIKAPHYVIITATKGEHALKVGGYIGEWFVLQLTREDIATCWISANHAEAYIAEQMQTPDNEEVVGIIAYGYAENEAHVANIYGQSAGGYKHLDGDYNETNISSRKSVEEIVFISRFGKTATIEKLEELGYADVFYYMRLAPSSVNRQPWRFIISRGKFILSISKDDGYDDDRMALLEAGIAMLYFEVAMHDNGYPGKWSFDSVDNSFGIPDSHFIAGTYSFI